MRTLQSPRLDIYRAPGLHSFDEELGADDIREQTDRDGRLSRLIAAQAPWKFRGGPDVGKTPRIYHSLSRGLVLNQLLMRADPQGRTVGEFVGAPTHIFGAVRI